MSGQGAIIALDCATVTGWALMRPSGHVACGSRKLANEGARDADVFAAFNNFLCDLITVENPLAIYYEAPITGPMTARPGAFRLMGLAALVETIGSIREIKYVRPVHIQSARAGFVGRGNIPKAEAKQAIIAACHSRGYAPKDHNAADALCCLNYAVNKLRTMGLSVPSMSKSA